MMTAFMLIMLAAATPAIEGDTLFLSADQSERAGLHDNAAKLFREAAEQSEPLRPYALSRAAKNHYAEGDAEEAEALFLYVLDTYADGPWTRPTHARLARMYREQERREKAHTHYNQALADMVPMPWFLDRMAWNAAENALETPGVEHEGYAWFRHVAATTIYIAPRRNAAKQLLESPEQTDRMWGVYGYARSGNLREVREAMNKEAVQLRGPEGVSVPLAALDMALAGAQVDMANTREQLGKVLRESRDDLWARVWLMLTVREQAGNNRFETAEMLAGLLSDLFPDGRDAGDVYWWLSERYGSQPNEAATLRMYRQLADRHPEHVRAPRSLFYLANHARENNQSENAYALYDRLGQLFPRGRFTAEGFYRAAEMAKAAGDSARHDAYLRRAAAVGPGHYYAHRALHKQNPTPDNVRRLRVTAGDDFIQPMPAVFDRVEPPHFLITNTDAYQRLRFFGIHGLEEGEWEALHIIKTSAPSLKDHWYPVIADSGFMHTLHQFVNAEQWGADEDGNPTAARWRVEYPLAYWEVMHANAKELDLDPYLTLAIARQESTFRAGVVSSAGATGVLQLMPATANWLADVDSRISADHVRHLKSPLNSIRLGTVYMHRMMNRSQQNMVYALASYNAGPGNLDRWRTRFANHRLEEFVEAIPFGETNHYVKVVLANYAAYHSIYPPPDTLFAE